VPPLVTNAPTKRQPPKSSPRGRAALSRTLGAVNPLMVFRSLPQAEGVQTVSITEAKQTFAVLVDAVEQSNEPVVITRRGEPAVVLMSFEKFGELRSSSHHADP
jgi:prevent-host-death family protein